MRALFMIVAAVALLPAGASAQPPPPLPAVYVCTPDAAVYKIENGSSTKLFNGTGAFNDCILGWDGNLYIANDSRILRINPLDKNTAKNEQSVGVFADTVGVRGLAFNGPVLYANTTAGIYKLVATGPEPTFSAPALVSAGGSGSPGGLVFDVPGNLVFAKGGDVRGLGPSASAATPHYSGAVQTLADATGAYGTAVDPCGQILYTDTSDKKIKRVGSPTEINVSPLFPLHMAADQWGSLYVVAAATVTGNNAKVYRYDFPAFRDCNGTPTRTEILSVNKAIGVAVAPREVAITQTFKSTDCELRFEFGYHHVDYKVNCGSSPLLFPEFTVRTVTRLTKPSALKFAGEFVPDATTHFNYSAYGGFAAEILHQCVAPSTGCAAPVAARGGYAAEYWYFTQDLLVVPAHAREGNEDVSAPYVDRLTLEQFWDLGVDPGGLTSRGDFGSKHLMVNINPPGLCQALPQNFEQPLTGLLTPAQAGSVLKIAFDATGQPDCSGGTLRLSVAKISDTPGSCTTVNVLEVATMPVESAGNAQTLNVMSNSGNRYSYNLDTSDYPSGTFRFTISGDKLQTVGGCFIVAQQ